MESHVGQGTPNPDCCCCNWKRNDPNHVRGCPRCGGSLTLPLRNPPPAGYSAEKWNAMPRRERRAAMRKGKR